MAIEIERKFLVKSDAFKKESYAQSRLRQGYLCSGNGNSVRIRIKDDRGILTIKGPGNSGGMSRFEWEKEIPLPDALDLLNLSVSSIIDKTRFLIQNTDGIHTWEVDEFYGDNQGLVMAEIELSDENEPFDKPDWLGTEVTGNPLYYNGSLSRNPYKNWR